MDKLKLMLLAEQQDCECIDEQEYEQEKNTQTKDQQYKDFYDDVKHPSNYIKEDW